MTDNLKVTRETENNSKAINSLNATSNLKVVNSLNATSNLKVVNSLKATSKTNDNVIFIGDKPFMNYVTGVVMQFNEKENKEVIIKARGRFISRAVDVAEVARKKFLQEKIISIGEIKIDSEEFESKEGKKVNVSTIEITLRR